MFYFNEHCNKRKLRKRLILQNVLHKITHIKTVMRQSVAHD